MAKSHSSVLKIAFVSILVISIVWLSGTAKPLASPAGTGQVTRVDTAISSTKLSSSAQTVKLSGLASGRLSGVELAVRRSDGRFWRSIDGTWTVDSWWQKGTLMPITTTKFFWDETLGLPPTDGDTLLVMARAVSMTGAGDPTPAGFNFFQDNVAPTVKTFEVRHVGGWVKSRQVELSADVEGASRMRLAESPEQLLKTRWRSYASNVRFRLSRGDGPKQIYGAFMDAAGNNVVAWLGAGLIVLDTAPPAPHRLAPAPDADSVSIGSQISVKFIEAGDIDPASLRSAPNENPTFYLTRNGAWTTASPTYDSRTKTVSLVPEAPLVKGERYTAHLLRGIKDIAGNELEEGSSWAFQAVEPSPPETRIGVFPKTVVSRDKVRLEGSATDADGITAVTVMVRDQAGRYWDSGSGTWTPEALGAEARLINRGKKNAVWRWSWVAPPSDDERFLITAIAGDRYLAQDPTPAGVYVDVDNQAPAVQKLVLQGGERVVATDTIEIENDVMGAAFMRFAQTPDELEKTPFQPFDRLTRFKLSKRQGEKMIFGQWADQVMNITKPGGEGTVASIVLDKRGPKVSSTFPHNDAADINTSVMLTVNFKEISLDEQSINSGTFKLLKLDGSEVAAQVRFDDISQSAILVPNELLDYGTGYKAVLDAQIKDKLGNAIGHNYGWNFKTIDISRHSPGNPRDLGVVSTEAGNRLTWKPPAVADKDKDFDPPAHGGYRVYRADSAGGPETLVNRVLLTGTNYLDKDYDRPGRYFYVIRAVDAGGSESEGSPVVANDEINANFKLAPGQKEIIYPANGAIKIFLPARKKSVNLSLKTAKISAVPPTPVLPVKITATKPVRFDKVEFLVPGDPVGLSLVKKSADGWLPLGAGSYEYDQAAKTVGFGPGQLAFMSRYALVSQTDRTPPEAPSGAVVTMGKTGPQITWSGGRDLDSGLSGYYIFRSETELPLNPWETKIATESLSTSTTSSTGTVGITPVAGATASVAATATLPAGAINSLPLSSLLGSQSTSFMHDATAGLSGSAIPPPVVAEIAGAEKASVYPAKLKFIDADAKPGRRYFYGVAAINARGLASPLALTEAAHVPLSDVGHRPRVAIASNCAGCHFQGQGGRVGRIDCRLCHDGTGSALEIFGNSESDKNTVCGSCHALDLAQLAKASKNGPGRCGPCHAGAHVSEDESGSSHSKNNQWNGLRCTDCHSLHRPDGRSRKFLIDPANGKKTWTRSITAFCLACHRSVGLPESTETAGVYIARTVTFLNMAAAPFFPGWAKDGWSQAQHRRVAGCVTCHQPHKSPNPRLQGYKSQPDEYAFFSASTVSESICYQCHGPGNKSGAKDLLGLSRLSSGHVSKAYGRHSDTETATGFGGDQKHVVCGDCHNVHESRKMSPDAGANNISPALRGVGGVEPNNGGPGTAPRYLEIFPARREYQICLKCHSSYAQAGPSGVADLGQVFNPKNLSFHPVEAGGKNRGLDKAAFAGDWDENSTMKCTDCHSSPANKGVRGPHGSEFQPMLFAPHGKDVGSNRQNDLCLSCHNADVYSGGQKGSRFGGAGGHLRHVAKERRGCYECHETHGSSFTEHLIKIIQPEATSGTTGFTHDSAGGSCVSTCHTRPAEVYRYGHEY